MNASRLAAAALLVAATPDLGLAGALARDALWDDGRAEYSLYEGTKPRYGKTRHLRARIVVVKEDLLDDVLIKSEEGPLPGRTTPVLKVNCSWEFETGTYVYKQMASVFLRRADLGLVKEVMTSSELCGITYVRETVRGADVLHSSHSYFADEGDRETRLAGAADAVPWDGLLLWLRDQDPGRDWMRQVKLLPSRISNHVPRPAAVRATLRCTAGETFEVPAGRFATRRVEVTTPAGTDRFWLDARYPHVLVKLAAADGTTLELRKTLRLAYWKRHDPGDERLIE